MALLLQPWGGMFKSFGRTVGFQQIEVNHDGRIYQVATKVCGDYGLWSEQALALMFHIHVQNGSIIDPARPGIFK